jgi:hypothetical protein
MPVACVIGVPVIITVAIMIVVTVSIRKVVTVRFVRVVMMVVPMVFCTVNVNVWDFISGVTVPERRTRASRRLHIQQQGFA